MTTSESARFTYLGSDIDSYGYSYPEIHRRLGIAGSIMDGSETWTMRKVDSDRIQSFHMQTLRRILGIRWYDKVSNAVVNERTKLPDVPCRLLLLTDVIHYLVTSVAYQRTNLLRRHCNCQQKPTQALLPLLTGSARRVVHGDIGCNKWKKPQFS